MTVCCAKPRLSRQYQNLDNTSLPEPSERVDLADR
jgi:hypothetical protein